MKNLVLNFKLLATYLYKYFYELYLQNNLQIFMILTNCYQYFNFKCQYKKIVAMYSYDSYNFLITIRINYEELFIKFSSILSILQKNIFRKIENFSCL
ncbi:hypothetical protein FWK35_00021784 [Aphis craccivora]|uniref:Uncharacterized protein n=1 Tax=Aphis craccivora TaxID=307492 RepID=A0A6G0YMY8_APHCR|nr:hypothetical protein FWK35_00021784 [Aphis craccivora]